MRASTPGPAGRRNLLLALLFVCALVLLMRPGPEPAPAPSAGRAERAAPSELWANAASLRDHFDRHGRDVGARDENDYARMAGRLLERAAAEGLPAKRDDAGVLRVFDPASRLFGAYNRDGTARTLFRPANPAYFERQPGRPVDLGRRVRE